MITDRTSTSSLPGLETTVTRYLLDRLAELGVSHLFGVPGDYNLALLDTVLEHESVRWVGTANELGAAYAADGFARTRGFGALLTTFGVGELSAINGVAGSYAERVALLHIGVGPSRATERSGAVVHHTAGDGDFERYARAFEQVTCAQAAPTDENAADEIDRVLLAALTERRPAYLRIRSDVASATIRSARSPLSYPAPAPVHADGLARFVSAARRRLDAAHSAVVLVDFLADRYGVAAKVRELVTAGPLPYATLSMGKGVLDETAVGALGVYSGAFSAPHVRQTVDGADLLIRVGVQLADTTSGGFTHGFAEDKGIEIRPTEVLVDGEVFPGIPMADALDELTALVREQTFPALEPAPDGPTGRQVESLDAPLTQEILWDTLAGWLKGHHTLVAEQGTSFFGIATRRLPNGARFVGQPLWGSIGYSLPALLGAQLADRTRRGVLLIGDGSAQMTIQELGTIARQGLTPVILLINNDGYTVERAIHGARQEYNNITSWNWSSVPTALGAPETLVLSAKTAEQLNTALVTAQAHSDRLVFIEVFTGMDDVPQLLADITEGVRSRNSGQA